VGGATTYGYDAADDRTSMLDGNGRTGRLLITFWLVERGILRKPVLYPSLFFKQHRDEYVGRLQAIRDDGAWEAWLTFFLDGIAQVATEATETATKILELRERDRALVLAAPRRGSANALLLLDSLFRFPVTTARAVQERLSVSKPTATALVSAFEGAGILHEVTGKSRNRVFAYREYLDLFPGATSRG
jgi:Fic family protein